MNETFKFIPSVGSLYLFRTDNVEYLYKKYGYYYDGIAICSSADVFDDLQKTGPLTSIIETYQKKKPLYVFHVFNCKQIYVVTDFSNPQEAEVNGKIYLNFNEVNEMLRKPSPNELLNYYL